MWTTNQHQMSEGESHVEPAGNTEPAGSRGRKQQSVQHYRWVFTLKAGESQQSQEIQEKEVDDMLYEYCKDYTFQLEEGEEGGYLHFQGVLSLKTKHRLHEVKNMLGWNHIHLEPCMNWYSSVKYCKKPETRVRGPWSIVQRPVKVKIQGELRPWQQELITYIDSEPDDRTIRIYQDPRGNAGKSTIGIHLMDIRTDILYVPSGKFEGVKEHVIRRIHRGGIRAVIFDIPRVKGDWIPKALMEELKNGFALNTRYETLGVRFDQVHVILFTNCDLPTYVWEQDFSSDRIQIIKLS